MSEATDAITKHIQALPPKLKAAIASIEMQKPLEEIRQKYGLMLDQASTLETETVLVAIGVEPGEEFVDNIIKNVGLNEIDAISIAKEINAKIFEKIKERIKKGEGPSESGGGETPEQKVENEKEILSAIEKPSPVGSRIKQSNAPSNLPRDTSPVGQVATGKLPDESKEQNTAFEKQIPRDPALEKLQSNLTSINEKQEIDERAVGKEKKYPGENDPYREPVE
jgi:hypothetical protein